MDCPACKNPMIILEFQQVETDYCPDCGGIWLDAGELEMLLGNTMQAQQLVVSFHRELDIKEKIRFCPICLKKMHKVQAGSQNKPVIIDCCPKGHGLWFDRGELARILSEGNLDKEQKIIKLLSEMFGQR